MKHANIALGTYNPSQVPKETLLKEFTARQEMLEDLLGTVRSNEPSQPCQHSLLIGPRGFGKTTSLYALKYRIEDDADLARDWVPLLFDEENYHIADLTGFWLECLRLAEAHFSLLANARYSELSISRDPELETLAQDAFIALLGDRKKRVVLLVDNLNDILSVVSDLEEQHRLRAFLQEESRICIIGTACTYFEAIRNSDLPFYNLFRVFRLDRFTVAELKTALGTMWDARSRDDSRVPLPDADGYWKGLHILTGGNPRLVKMIFQLLEQGVTPDFRAQLEGLLDAYTPYFKHRIESMSPQQRRVFDAIAMAWDPVRLSDIAPGLRMESNKISAQVKMLIDAQLVAVAGGTSKRKTYQIADRFSNIYYFMRYSRAGRSRFEWFVVTMKAILSPEQYCTQLDRMRKQLLTCTGTPDFREQMQLLTSATRAIDDGDQRRQEGRKSVATFLTAEQESALKHLLSDPSMREVLEGEHEVVTFLANLPKAKRKEIGYRPDDSEWWTQLALAALAAELWSVAEQACRQAIVDNPDDAARWNDLGYVLQEGPGRYEDAREAYEKAIQINPADARPWYNLGTLLQDHLARYEEAKEAYEKAIQIDPGYAYSWYNLGTLLQDHLAQSKKAQEAYRKAIEVHPDDACAWNNLGTLLHPLARYAEAERAYRMAIGICPRQSASWNNLGNLIRNDLARYEEAEGAYRKAIEIEPGYAYPKAGLANVLADLGTSPDEAIELATDALMSNPEEEWMQNAFARVAIHVPEAASRVLASLADRLKTTPPTRDDEETEQTFVAIYQLALGCVRTLIRNDRCDEALRIIEETETQEAFDIPIQAIHVLRNPDVKRELAEERLALVEAFLESIDASPNNE